jgi:nitronate monooxygenase
MLARWNQNRLTTKLGIEYPIIQGPLGGLSSQRLTAAVSNFGGLGSFGAHALTPEAIKDVIADWLPYIEPVRNELVGINGRRRRSKV